MTYELTEEEKAAQKAASELAEAALAAAARKRDADAALESMSADEKMVAREFGMTPSEWVESRGADDPDLARRVWEALPDGDREAVIEERVQRERGTPGFADPALVQKVRERLNATSE